MGNNNSEIIVAVVALVVSVVALMATFMQVLQQYYASAAGYSQCNEKVMGNWAKTKTRRFSWEELRFEVEFDSPVIFVCAPSNKRGPVVGEDIYILNGTPKSVEETWTSKLDPRAEYEMRSVKEKVHTADNERASWFVLLFAIQSMEEKSREWQKEQYKALGPPGELMAKYGLPNQSPSLEKHHTLAVALQRKRKSWDTMPSSVTKPYATTTMCHIIEMTAMLGVYWKEFDRRRDRYRAEGNGFMVLGEKVSDLGIMFSFQIYSKCHFERKRVIPVDDVKELCFGYVPTIYRSTLDPRRLEFPNDEPQNMSSLQMSKKSEIAETLIVIGCNNNTVKYFLTEGKRTSHLFPISFEILGMLSRNFHLKNSSFTYIPNPTSDRWDSRAVSLVDMMMCYGEHLEDELPGATVSRNDVVVDRIRHHIREILNHKNDDNAPERLLCLKALHLAVDDMDELLTARAKTPSEGDGDQRDKSGNGLPLRSQETNDQADRREIVQDVLRSHLQEVLRLLNERDDRGSDSQSLVVPDMAPPSPGTPRPWDAGRLVQSGFDDMDSASPDERQAEFMKVYFSAIRRKVVLVATNSTTDRRASSAGGTAPAGFGLRRRGTGQTHTGTAIPSTTIPSTAVPNTATQTDTGATQSSTTGVQAGGRGANGTLASAPLITRRDTPAPGATGEPIQRLAIPLAYQRVSHDDVWCALIFRMICWLMLHDFDKADVQLSKSEVLGSRMPVYIS